MSIVLLLLTRSSTNDCVDIAAKLRLYRPTMPRVCRVLDSRHGRNYTTGDRSPNFGVGGGLVGTTKLLLVPQHSALANCKTLDTYSTRVTIV